jgi:hypothetical protein
MAGPIIYDSSAIYVQSAANKVERINRIDEILDALYIAAVTAAENDGVTDYFLNDGQVQIKSTYRSAEQVQKSIKAFEAMKQMYLNQLNGRMTRLVDGKNFT